MTFAPLQPPRTIGDLLARRPVRWGLRGDTYLWLELERRLADEPLPDRWFALRSTLEAAWADAVGCPLTDSAGPIHLERLDPGQGISAGSVLPSWWHGTGIPILVDRYCAFSGEW